MKDYAKEAIHNVENTRLISILKALALAIQADVNCTLTPEQCRTIVREIDYLRQEEAGRIEDALRKRAEAAEARVAELESTISAIENILNKPNQKPKKDYQDSFDNAIYRLNKIKLFFPQSEVGG